MLINTVDTLATSLYKTSVIIPVYNEAAIIDKTLDSLIEFASSNPDIYFLFYNDGSSDNTAAIIKTRIAGIKNIALIDNKENKGKAMAIKEAFTHLDSELICFTDGDMAYSLDHILKLVDTLAKYDVVVGNRNLIENPKVKSAKRAIAGEVFNRLARLLLNHSIKDTQAGIKGFRKEAAKRLFHLSRINDFAFDAELIYIAMLKGYTIGQIPAKVNEFHQLYPSTVKVLRDSPGMFLSLLKIIYYRYTGKYDE